MAQLEPAMPSQEPLPPLHQQSPFLDIRTFHQPVSIEGKEATIHDFLSLGGSKRASSTIAGAQNGLQSSRATQDLLHRLENAPLSTSSNILPAAFAPGSSKTHINIVDYNAGQQMVAHDLISGGVDMQPKYRSSDFSYSPKAHGPHNNKHLLQQQKRKPIWVTSEDEEDEDDESVDHGYNSKKEMGYQRFNNAQQLEGKNMDCKELTSRSKHSATEQRRRSKINDRFQMLKQLLPNPDQKRDKASLLLEVIEYIQILHEKVKKYEAAEHLGQPNALPWDKTSGCKRGVIDVSHGTSVMYGIKGGADANGSMGHQCPLRVAGHGNGITPVVGHANGITQVELISSRGHASPSDYNSLISKPTVITFMTPPSICTEGPPTTTNLFPYNSPEGRTTFAQLLHQEEQATMRSKHFYCNKEVIVSPHMHQAGKSMVPQMSNSCHDPGCEKLRSPKHSPVAHRDGRGKEEMVEALRSSPVRDLHQRNLGSTTREFKADQDRISYGVNGTSTDANLKRPKENCRGEVMAHDQGPSAFLGGIVNISSPFSQGLLNSLTQALQSSGVDLARASLSVQIDLGKQSGAALARSTEIATVNTAMPSLQNKDDDCLQKSEHSSKRLKVEMDT